LNDLIAKEREYITKDQKIIHGYEQRNKFESEFYALKERLSGVRNNSLKDYVNPTLFNEYTCYFSELENNLEHTEDYSAELTKAQAKIKEFFAKV
jgi:uncharacterized protein (UPF0305 family)